MRLLPLADPPNPIIYEKLLDKAATDGQFLFERKANHSERMGRKATGLNPFSSNRDKAAGLPQFFLAAPLNTDPDAGKYKRGVGIGIDFS